MDKLKPAKESEVEKIWREKPLIKLSDNQIIDIITEKRIASVSEEERRQVMVFAFGEEFVSEKEESKDE